nr:paraneoplastic antigen Ma6E-like [Aegilops tauschii subsp. strangulata]
MEELGGVGAADACGEAGEGAGEQRRSRQTGERRVSHACARGVGVRAGGGRSTQAAAAARRSVGERCSAGRVVGVATRFRRRGRGEGSRCVGACAVERARSGPWWPRAWRGQRAGVELRDAAGRGERGPDAVTAGGTEREREGAHGAGREKGSGGRGGGRGRR